MDLQDFEDLGSGLEDGSSMDVNIAASELECWADGLSERDEEESGSEAETTLGEMIELHKVVLDLESSLVFGNSVQDIDHAYILYCEYGHTKGFSVRRGEQRYFGKSDVLRWKKYLCSAAGMPDCKGPVSHISAYKKLITHTGCKSKIIKCKGDGGGWAVTQFITEHNYALVPVELSYMLRSCRHLTYAKSSLIDALTSFDVGVSSVY